MKSVAETTLATPASAFFAPFDRFMSVNQRMPKNARSTTPCGCTEIPAVDTCEEDSEHQPEGEGSRRGRRLGRRTEAYMCRHPRLRRREDGSEQRKKGHDYGKVLGWQDQERNFRPPALRRPTALPFLSHCATGPAVPAGNHTRQRWKLARDRPCSKHSLSQVEYRAQAAQER